MQDKLLLLFGFAGSQALTMLALPVITKLYAPDSFGFYSYHLAIVSFLGYVSCFRLNLKQQLTKDNVEIKNLCYLITILFSASVFIMVFLVTNNIVNSFFYFVTVIFLGFYEINTDFQSSKKNYFIIAKCNITRTLITIAVQTFFYKFEYGLFWGFFVGLSISQLVVYRADFKIECKSFERSDINFMLKNTLISLVGYAGSSLPLIMVFHFTSAFESGLYSLADKLSLAIIVIINNVVSRLIYNDLNDVNSLIEVILSWYKRTISLLMVLVLVIFLIPNNVFLFIFSESWHSSFDFFKALVPWVGLQILIIPFSCAYIKVGLENKLLKLEFFKNLVRVSFITGLLINGMSTYDAIVISSLITGSLSIFFYYRDFKRNEVTFY